MPTTADQTDTRVKCDACPLGKLKQFRRFSSEELSFVTSFKTGELSADIGTTLMLEGTNSAHLYTLLSGWSFRYKILEDGRRQILNYALPGDLLGLQSGLMGEMQHSVEALTDLVLCVFERDRLFELFKNHPTLAYDITWIAAREERILDEHLLSVGRRSALERAAYLLAFLHTRGQVVRAFTDKKQTIPITQQHIADTLGLSIVHTNKTLRKLVKRGAVQWLDRGCQVLDVDELIDIAGWSPEFEEHRPFI